MITKLNRKDKTIKSYAIRKLTPKECFRLMGVRDEVIDQMQMTFAEATANDIPLQLKGKDESMVISASQQYKQAGNSIVVDVLAAIYEQIWFPKVKPANEQTSFFDMFDAMEERPQDNNTKIFVTTFSGYDSQLMAANLLKQRHPEFEWKCMGWSDIDKYACQMHDLVFPQYADKALGDITKIDWHKVKESLNGEEVDLFTYSSPCQDISQAGKQMGLKEGSGSRSALLWNVADAIEILKPKYLLQENVAALVSQKFMPDFQKWLDKLYELGYTSYWTTLNAKEYGVPQNRDRVFCLSIRKDIDHSYNFPSPVPLEKKLEDILEEEVDSKFFLNDEAVGKFLTANNADDAVFVQFSIEPTHENAMFLKTWLQMFMADKWQHLTNDEMLIELEFNKKYFYQDFKVWKDDNDLYPFRFGDFGEFVILYNYNLHRNDKPDSICQA